jgi:hypothetical protein
MSFQARSLLDSHQILINLCNSIDLNIKSLGLAPDFFPCVLLILGLKK